ncbi:MAG TPA: hypothetical protein VMR52_06235 [Dehalococcoidia bacterium]|nr:hypothetical protein [Dehalococcoidia bacterium]
MLGQVGVSLRRTSSSSVSTVIESQANGICSITSKSRSTSGERVWMTTSPGGASASTPRTERVTRSWASAG